MFCFFQLSYAGSYESIASSLVNSGAGLKGEKLVIIPFKTGSGLPGYAGESAAHKLQIKLTQEIYYDVITKPEFEKADAWLKENGDSNKNYALQLMERLNAKLAVTGEINRKSDSAAELKVRLINPFDKKTISTISDEIPNEWASIASSGGAEHVPAQEQNMVPAPAAGYSFASTENASAGSASQSYSSSSAYDYGRDLNKKRSDYAFFDIFYGLSNSQNLSMEFKPQSGYLYVKDFIDRDTYASSFELNDLETDSKGPIGFRFGMFQDVVGFDLGFRYASYETKAQNGETNLVNYSKAPLPKKYAMVDVYEMNGDLLFRFVNSSFADIYAGIGLGMNLTHVELPYVKGYTGFSVKQPPVKETGFGMSFRIPVGARWKLSDSVHLLTEASFEASMTMGGFSRNIVNEDDTYYLWGFQTIAGIGFVF